MSLVLIDTDIASFILKGSNYADPYQPLLSGQELALSFMTIAELFQWAILRQWGDRRLTQLEQYLSNYLMIPSVTCRFSESASKIATINKLCTSDHNAGFSKYGFIPGNGEGIISTLIEKGKKRRWVIKKISPLSPLSSSLPHIVPKQIWVNFP